MHRSVRRAEGDTEEPDGSPAIIGTDLVGVEKAASSSTAAGPLSTLESGASRVRVW